MRSEDEIRERIDELETLRMESLARKRQLVESQIEELEWVLEE